jgi:hypothetical protein
MSKPTQEVKGNETCQHPTGQSTKDKGQRTKDKGQAVRLADCVPIGGGSMLLLQVAAVDHRRQGGQLCVLGKLPISDYHRGRFCNANDSTSVEVQERTRRIQTTRRNSMRKQLLQLRDPLGIQHAIDTEPKIGAIDPEVGETIVSKIATRIEPNVFEVTIWHESDFKTLEMWTIAGAAFVRVDVPQVQSFAAKMPR